MAGDAAQPMIDWINSAPPPELAVELMAAFGPDGRDNVTRSGFENGCFVGLLNRGFLAHLSRGGADTGGHSAAGACRTDLRK